MSAEGRLENLLVTFALIVLFAFVFWSVTAQLEVSNKAVGQLNCGFLNNTYVLKLEDAGDAWIGVTMHGSKIYASKSVCTAIRFQK